MTLWSYTISTPALVAAIGIALATIVCSIRACRRSHGRRFIALEALRLIIVALLVFTLFKPERLTHTSYTEQPLHLVLYDMSESMATLDVADGNTFITRAIQSSSISIPCSEAPVFDRSPRCRRPSFRVHSQVLFFFWETQQ